MDAQLLATAAAFGLASSAGLNTTLPLFLVGLMSRLGLMSIATPYDALSSDVALVGLAGFSVVEFLADKVPVVDSVFQVLQWPVSMAAGAVLFASQHSVLSEVSPGLTILIGVILAGSVHGLRTAARPALNLSTFGIGGPIVSFLEDATAVLLVLMAVLAPILAVALLAALVYVGFRVARRGRRGIAALQRWRGAEAA
jgi:hypothetical protein